jgi:hypothetical protein
MLDKPAVVLGDKLPALLDAGLVDDSPETASAAGVAALYEDDQSLKVFGPGSSLELDRIPGMGWYKRGFFTVTAGCFLLILPTWLITPMLSVWN